MSRDVLDREAILKDGCIVLQSLKRKALSGNVPAMKAFLDFAFSEDESERAPSEYDNMLSDDQRKRIMDICMETGLSAVKEVKNDDS